MRISSQLEKFLLTRLGTDVVSSETPLGPGVHDSEWHPVSYVPPVWRSKGCELAGILSHVHVPESIVDIS